MKKLDERFQVRDRALKILKNRKQMVAAGVVIGAIAAGPFGAFVGGVAGYTVSSAVRGLEKWWQRYAELGRLREAHRSGSAGVENFQAPSAMSTPHLARVAPTVSEQQQLRYGQTVPQPFRATSQRESDFSIAAAQCLPQGVGSPAMADSDAWAAARRHSAPAAKGRSR
ncbi:hypothetical protein [Streptomyces sp. NPDC020951]|uniref:hypothetical protein n=1 Tax=Streptomyces sp. NPDC020951 TaxID=3365104 RepID=UPI0037A76D3E